MDNAVYYFYPIAPLIETELNKISEIVNDSMIGRDETKAKTLKLIKINITRCLNDLKRRHEGCRIHHGIKTSIDTIRNLIDDAGDRDLFAEYNLHADNIEKAIDWDYYESNLAKVTHEIELAYQAYGFEEEYRNKLAHKLC